MNNLIKPHATSLQDFDRKLLEKARQDAMNDLYVEMIKESEAREESIMHTPRLKWREEMKTIINNKWQALKAYVVKKNFIGDLIYAVIMGAVIYFLLPENAREWTAIATFFFLVIDSKKE